MKQEVDLLGPDYMLDPAADLENQKLNQNQ
jgi:hypothetical protein